MKHRTQAAIHAHALEAYPREACGVIVVRRGRERYIPCENLAGTPDEHFVLSPRDLAAAEDQGEVTAIVHSHPDVPARPSEADRVGCERSELPWVIVSVMPGEPVPVVADTQIIEPNGYEAPLVGRTWSHGVLDCWALCRDWYARERGILLPDPPRADGWWDDGSSDLYGDSAMEAAGFRKIDLKDIAAGDLILMQIRSKNLVPNHAALYIGDGNILHHLHGRLSSRDVYGGYWQEVTRSVWRLGDLAAPTTMTG
ncbi:C40 family peptidase [Luteibacter sp. SG786]|uniref:C40 family peptidase n=1 Tax=Luteibacter sp. SG786 TaxID=2587130 RepID=UPI0014207E68|nr:C40 family peptidase [Luteibacter sp. SG786]NII53592.1 proteasome lid subunit RPN8/RPN11 [Luteibacter sp. SG786]